MLVFKHTYYFNVTEELDEDYLKYLRRRIGTAQTASAQGGAHERAHGGSAHHPEVKRLDISVDDEEGDVVAGLAAHTEGSTLHIDLLWVDTTLRGAGLGAKLVSMAEEIARERGCTHARIGTMAAGYYTRFGYVVSGQVSQFPSGQPLYFMQKPLVEEESAIRQDSA